MKPFALIISLILLSSHLFGQDLLNERIRKITGRKKSVFLNQGVFHNGGPKIKSTLKAVRHSFRKNGNFERVVFDFSTKQPPRIYGYISPSEKKVYIDFFDTTLQKGIGSFGSSQYVKGLNFFPIDRDSLSVEVVVKDGASLDIFYLENPARLVLDIKI